MFHGKVTETYDVLWSGRFKHLNFALIVAAYRVTHDINTTVKLDFISLTADMLDFYFKLA